MDEYDFYKKYGYSSYLERHKEVYERHQKGELYKDIAKDYGISSNRARQLALRWEEELRRQEARLTKRVLDAATPSKKFITCPHCGFTIELVAPEPPRQ